MAGFWELKIDVDKTRGGFGIKIMAEVPSDTVLTQSHRLVVWSFALPSLLQGGEGVRMSMRIKGRLADSAHSPNPDILKSLISS